MLYKFWIKLFNSFTGEILAEFEVNPTQIPDEMPKMLRWMEAYVRKQWREPNVPLGMTIHSEKMLNYYTREGRHKEQDFFENAYVYESSSNKK